MIGSEKFMFRWIILIVGTLITSVSAHATTYYVSPTGSDSSSGQTPQRNSVSDGPFSSLHALELLALKPGDRVMLACGGRYAGPLHLRLSVTSESAVEIDPYGDCTAQKPPVIDGRAALTSAQSVSGLQTFQPRGVVTQVFLGGNPIPVARFPERGYLLAASSVQATKDRLPSYDELKGRDLRGARLVARTQEWYVEERTVGDASGQLSAALEWPIRPKTGIYLTGKAWMIGNVDAWAYDAASKTLSIRNSKSQPVSVSYAEPLVSIEGKGSVALKGIGLDAAGADGLNVHVDGKVSIDNMNVSRSAENGIAIAGASEAKISGSTVTDTGRDGIFFAEVHRASVQGSNVVNAGLYGGVRPSLGAINAQRTDAALIENNHVTNSAYIGIRFGGDAQIRRNLVEASCRTMSDCAAIYTWRRNVNDLRPPVQVAGNVIVGVAGDTSVKTGVRDYFAGIYLDEFTRFATLVNNVIVDAGQGIYIHNSISNAANHNLIAASRERDMLIGIDKTLYPSNLELTNAVADNVSLPAGDSWHLVRTSPTGAPAAGPSDSGWTIEFRSGQPNDERSKGGAGCTPLTFADSSAPASAQPAAAAVTCR